MNEMLSQSESGDPNWQPTITAKNIGNPSLNSLDPLFLKIDGESRWEGSWRTEDWGHRPVWVRSFRNQHGVVVDYRGPDVGQVS